MRAEQHGLMDARCMTKRPCRTRILLKDFEMLLLCPITMAIGYRVRYEDRGLLSRIH